MLRSNGAQRAKDTDLAPQKHDTLAAIDLGSNSFHLQIGRVVEDQIYLLDSLREPVRLGAGLTRDKRLDRATQLRALEALGRFGERLRGFPPGAVRAVGTNALRVAKNAEQFLADAEEVLGFPIEVVFGREEARLIYLGVAHTLAPGPSRRLVVDIGGGSTEFVIGTGLDPELMESVPMGCVSYSLQFFPGGAIDKQGFRRAETAAANELQRLVKSYRKAGWSEAVASSGTAKTIASICAAQGWAEHGITSDGLERLRSHMIRAGDASRLRLEELSKDRAPVLPGGVAILGAVFAELGIGQMEVSGGALRDGVLYDLLGRTRHHDQREATVSQFQRRYQADPAQASRVDVLARALLAKLGAVEEDDAQMLRWAAALHEIGISIAYTGYHKHSAYILSQADMPGFSQREQRRLARLVLAHRGKLSKGELEELATDSRDWSLIFALRTATLFIRSRGDVELPELRCRAVAAGFKLALPGAWLEAHPLTEAALDRDADEWRAVGLELEIVRTAEEKARASG
jgi:exopolyphosphatase/guanosine-5'-triphosphate,3'-diphosphate pyrophosphatase